jgi:hypothetical protein
MFNAQIRAKVRIVNRKLINGYKALNINKLKWLIYQTITKMIKVFVNCLLSAFIRAFKLACAPTNRTILIPQNTLME